MLGEVDGGEGGAAAGTWLALAPVDLERHRQLVRNHLADHLLEVARSKNDVIHFLPGTNPFLTEFAERHGIPVEATRGGAATMYPEYIAKLKTMKPPSAPK